MRIAAVSPHLDDAAMSASVRLAAAGATVLTVFTALPPAGLEASWWDRLTGATSSAARQRERIEEDHAAMQLLGTRAVHLGAPDAQYRAGAPDLDHAVERMTREFADCDQVWLPSAIGGHRDHRAARDAGLRAAVAAGHAEVVLYADFPYVVAFGWPSWVTGEPADPYVDASFWLDDQIRAVGLDVGALTPEVIRLNAEQRQRKAAVIAAYRTQAPVLRLSPADLAREPGKLDYELAWRMSLTGPPSPRNSPSGD
ncbi:MAG TPA: PIG-L family deacetylase [Streptosporangiaceae bacterium]